MAGILLWVLSAFALFALATWNAGDPSWSYAADAPVSNAMGYPGAIVSDIFMQFFGLAALPALLPTVFWGYARIRGATGRMRPAGWRCGQLRPSWPRPSPAVFR